MRHTDLELLAQAINLFGGSLTMNSESKAATIDTPVTPLQCFATNSGLVLP
jgi:hypothetical protein